MIARLSAGLAVLWVATHFPQAHAQPQTQVRFAGPKGMQIRWIHRTSEGKEEFSKIPLETPGRFNFFQGGTYRLKLSMIPGHPGLELYPTLQVLDPGPAVREYLMHNAVALELNADDFRDALAGMQVTKTIFLPDANQRTENVLLVLRIGNVDLNAPGGAKK